MKITLLYTGLGISTVRKEFFIFLVIGLLINWAMLYLELWLFFTIEDSAVWS